MKEETEGRSLKKKLERTKETVKLLRIQCAYRAIIGLLSFIPTAGSPHSTRH
jgi:hypothetical protein